MAEVPLRVGIIGLGAVGRLHLRALAGIAGVEVVGASNLRAGSTEAERDEVAHLHRYASAVELIADPSIDVVAICSGSGSHAWQAKAALAAGKHLVIEKPIAVDPVAAAEIAEAADRSPQVVSVMSQRRFEVQHVYLKKLIDQGVLGRPILIEGFTHWHRDEAYYAASPWRQQQSEGGGSLMNQGIHIVDLMIWLFGEVAEVRGEIATLGHSFDAEDTAVATLRFTNGALGLLASSTAIPQPTPPRLDLFFAKGTISLEDGGVARWDVPGIPPPPVADIPTGSSDPTAIGVAGHRAQWLDIVAAIRTRSAPAITCQSALATAQVCAAVYQSAATRH